MRTEYYGVLQCGYSNDDWQNVDTDPFNPVRCDLIRHYVTTASSDDAGGDTWTKAGIISNRTFETLSKKMFFSREKYLVIKFVHSSWALEVGSLEMNVAHIFQGHCYVVWVTIHWPGDSKQI